MEVLSQEFDVLAIGELNPDLIFLGLQGELGLGRETLADQFHMRLGSSTAIAAAQMAGLGLKVALVSRVGKDAFGAFCRGQLEHYGVDTKYLIEDADAATGVTVSVSYPEDRMLLTHLGTISRLSRADVSDAMLRSARHVHVSSFYLQDGLRPGCVDLFGRAKSLGLTISLDTGHDPSEVWDSGIGEVLHHVDVFFPNEVELGNIAVGDTLEEKAKKLVAERPGLVVAAKLGAKGCLLADTNGLHHIPGYVVTPIDTTGAGDSFNAGFIAGMLSGFSLQRCGELGNACGALSTQQVGGAGGLHSIAGMEEWMEQAEVRNISHTL